VAGPRERRGCAGPRGTSLTSWSLTRSPLAPQDVKLQKAVVKVWPAAPSLVTDILERVTFPQFAADMSNPGAPCCQHPRGLCCAGWHGLSLRQRNGTAIPRAVPSLPSPLLPLGCFPRAAGEVFLSTTGGTIRFAAGIDKSNGKRRLRMLSVEVDTTDPATLLSGLGIPGASGIDMAGIALTDAAVVYVPAVAGAEGELHWSGALPAPPRDHQVVGL
jgi:hypothetical protein